jgi:hypothetical protein
VSSAISRPGQAATPAAGGRGAPSPAGRGVSPGASAAGRGVPGASPNMAGRGSPVGSACRQGSMFGCPLVLLLN